MLSTILHYYSNLGRHISFIVNIKIPFNSYVNTWSEYVPLSIIYYLFLCTTFMNVHGIWYQFELGQWERKLQRKCSLRYTQIHTTVLFVLHFFNHTHTIKRKSELNFMLTVLKEEQYSLSKLFQLNIHSIKQNSAKNIPSSRTHSCNESDDGKSSYRLWNDLLYE